MIPVALGAQEAVSIGPEGGLQRLRDAEVDHSGRVFALDGGMVAITVFHPDGRPLTILRGDPERDIRFEDPVAVAIDSTGLLHVLEAGLAVPFGRSGLMSATEAEFITVDTGSPEFRVHGPDGGLRRIVRLELTPTAVTSEDITRIREQYLGSAPPGAREEIEPILDRIPIPRTLPLFSELKIGGDGAVWLRGPRRFRDEEVREWLVVPRGGGTP